MTLKITKLNYSETDWIGHYEAIDGNGEIWTWTTMVELVVDAGYPYPDVGDVIEKPINTNNFRKK